MVKDISVPTVWEVPDVSVRTGVWRAPFSENDGVVLNWCVILAKATIHHMLTSCCSLCACMMCSDDAVDEQWSAMGAKFTLATLYFPPAVP
jgi:hypothetical protein